VDWFISFKFLHIATMFFAVALAISGEVVIRRVAASHDVRAIRATVSRVRPLSGNLSTVFFVVGIGFGILAALAGQISLLAPWLILAYVAFGAALAIGLAITDPWVARLEREAAESPVEGASEALVQVITDRRALAATWALMALIVTLIFLMVVKPSVA
jgi:hypothetical protein